MKKTRLALLLAAFATVALGFVGCQPEVEVEHVHTFADAWTFDESSHWHEATCGHDEKSNLGTHNFSEWKTVVEPTEYEDGSKERTCSTCKYVDKEIILALGHHHNLKSEWSSDKTSHWHAYDCGRPEHFEDKAEHSYEWITTDPNKHWKVCSVCGEKVEESAHDFGTPTISKKSGTKDEWEKNYSICPCGKTKQEIFHADFLDFIGAYDSTKMTFGVYPQTIKASNVTVDKSVKNTEITGADYYLGSDGAWYAECVEHRYESWSWYKYSDGSSVAEKSANSVKYFKVEPIEWVYLAETKCLHAKKILTANVMWDEDDNNYKNSNIRSWLNGTFFDSAFTESQKGKIKTTNVDNSAASTTDAGNKLTQATSYACENTQDKVFLLSEKEATASGNGFTADADRIRFPTDYALANCCNKSSDSDGGWWWLRSPDDLDSDVARGIFYGGFFYNYSDVDFKYSGVVPALSLNEYE